MPKPDCCHASSPTPASCSASCFSWIAHHGLLPAPHCFCVCLTGQTLATHMLSLHGRYVLGGLVGAGFLLPGMGDVLPGAQAARARIRRYRAHGNVGSISRLEASRAGHCAGANHCDFLCRVSSSSARPFDLQTQLERGKPSGESLFSVARFPSECSWEPVRCLPFSPAKRFGQWYLGMF